MLKGFFKGEPVPSPLNSDRLIEGCQELARAAREAGVPVIFIKDNFWPEEVDIDIHFKLFGAHCIVGTPDAEVLDELEPQSGDFQIRKKRYSGFQGTRLDQVLRELGVTDLYFGGTWDGCVRSTHRDGRMEPLLPNDHCGRGGLLSLGGRPPIRPAVHESVLRNPSRVAGRGRRFPSW